MLCNKCYEDIPKEKEVQVEGTIICKECALIVKKEDKEKVVARCWNCNQPICKGELIHEFTKNDSKTFSKWFLIESGSSEKLFQCDECYQKWRSDVKKAQNLSRIRFLLLGLCTGYSFLLVSELFFPEIAKKVNMPLIITLLVILFIVAIIIEPILNANRYKISINKKKSKK